MLPRARTSTLLCGLAALCVALTHASIASAFESTPSSYGNDHGGGDSRLSVPPSPRPSCPTFVCAVCPRVSPRIVAYVPPLHLSLGTGASRRVATRRGAGDPQVRRAPAARRNCYGDFIDRVRACAPSLVAQYDELNVALRPPGRYAAAATAAKRARKERRLLNSVPSSPPERDSFFFPSLYEPSPECEKTETEGNAGESLKEPAALDC